jgi:N-acetylmuramoyl-L-alanine amidase
VVLLPIAVTGLVLACKQVPHEQERMARHRAASYMVKDSSLLDQFEITGRGLEMLGTDTGNGARVPEAVIYWDEVGLFIRMVQALPLDTVLHYYETKGDNHWDAAHFGHLPSPVAAFTLPRNAEQPLAGMRIALDPGHVGGSMDYAQTMEEKYVRIRPDPDAGIPEEIGFCEGNLALGTALLLAGRLREEGAEVLLTREREGLNAFGITFDQWLQGEVAQHERWLRENGRTAVRSDPESWKVQCAAANYLRECRLSARDSVWWMTKATAVHVHRTIFLKAEFQERARIINAFRPHVTLILHYNVGEDNRAASDGYRLAIPEDHCMAFIPGGYMNGELKEPQDRLAFAARLLSDDLPQSERLSGFIVRAHERLLGVPAMAWDDRLQYLKNSSLLTREKGVFARNLQLTRLVQGTLCFGESLYQDNLQEARLLNAKDFILPGMTTPLPHRIREVADAYYQGLHDWLDNQ